MAGLCKVMLEYLLLRGLLVVIACGLFWQGQSIPQQKNCSFGSFRLPLFYYKRLLQAWKDRNCSLNLLSIRSAEKVDCESSRLPAFDLEAHQALQLDQYQLSLSRSPPLEPHYPPPAAAASASGPLYSLADNHTTTAQYCTSVLAA